MNYNRSRSSHGGYQGSRRGDRSYHRCSKFTLEIPVPAGCDGLIIGPRGSSIKQLQGMSGIDFVRLQDGILKIGGESNDVVKHVEFIVREKINNAVTSNSSRMIRQFHLDFGGCGEEVRYLRYESIKGSCPISFAPYLCEKNFDHRKLFMLSKVSTDKDFLEKQLSGLSLDESCLYEARGFSRLPLNLEYASSGFVQSLNDIDHKNLEHLKVEIRFSGCCFVDVDTTSMGDHSTFSVKDVAKCTDKLKSQFSLSLNIPEDALQRVAEENGFDLVECVKVSVVHLVALETRTTFHAKFYEDVKIGTTEERVDQRLTETKKAELIRISKCSSARAILEIPPGASSSEVKKAWKKKNMLVHPDKNAFIGANEAAKFVQMAKSELLNESKCDNTYSPKLFDVSEPSDESNLPKLKKVTKGKNRYFLMDTVADSYKLGQRFVLEAEKPVETKSVKSFLEKAWKNGNITAGGELSMDKSYSIEAVRLKSAKSFTDGEFDLKIELVKQKSTRSHGEFTQLPELVLTYPSLTEASKNPEMHSHIPELFVRMMQRARVLAQAFSSVPERIQ